MKPLHCLMIVSSFLCVTPAFAQDTPKPEDTKGILSLVVENDSIARHDRDYTNGMRLSWISGEANMPQWARTIASVLPLASEGNKRISIAAGQSIFTPENTQRTTPLIGDRPYAGWLYGSIGMVSDTGKTLDNVMLTLGVVGPWSFARQTQSEFHDAIGISTPKGWKHQLKNEPGVIFTYERKWRGMFEITPFGLGADITPHVGVNIGNVNTDASAGATFRLGFDLPADYGPPRIRPSLPGSDFFIPTQNLSGYLFTTISGSAVARNIFLDGNSFRDGPHVHKKILVGSAQAGAVVTYGDFRLSYTHVLMTKEYDTQRRASTFGAITLSYRF